MVRVVRAAIAADEKIPRTLPRKEGDDAESSRKRGKRKEAAEDEDKEEEEEKEEEKIVPEEEISLPSSQNGNSTSIKGKRYKGYSF